MTNQQIIESFRSIFPDETIQIGQRLKKHQVEIINQIALELKLRSIGENAIRESSKF